MPMYNLIEYNDNYSRDEPVAIMINPESFKCKTRIKRKNPVDDYVEDVKLSLQLKCWSDFLRNLEMPLINC